MELPNVRHPIRDPETNVTYVVMAYRHLTQSEVVQTVRMHQRQTRKKPKRGSTITILTVLGATQNL
ncbi:hypothetical protein ABWU93_11565 [Xanthomonas translucens pv. translucens]|uniref:hypothetical protein n=1 Tax=Xanthomonas campestris pv. translucens TaxID=343 RepID=UPI003F6F73F1